MFDEAASPSATDTQAESEPVIAENDAASVEAKSEAPAEVDEAPAEHPAVAKFKSCRWHATQDSGGSEYCSHRDVQPYAGMNGFNPEAWCVDCEFFKVRRTVKKRNTFDPDDY